MLDEGKIRLLRGVASWLLDGLGVWGMFACAAVILLGPRYLSIVLALASIFMLAYWIRRAGVALK